MDCIFKKSKYYAAAVADPLKIIEPIGYQFFAQNNLKKPQFKKKEGQLINKFVSDKTIMKQISSRGIPNKEIDKFLKRSESTRKNYYLEGTKQEFITQQLSYTMLIQMRNHFFRKFEDKQLIQFFELMQCLSILNQSMYSIKDYALSTFIVYYSGSNKKFYDFLQETLRQEFLEYDSQILINEPKISRPQLRKIEFKNIKEIIEYTNEVNRIAGEKDKHFSGAHLFISHNLPQYEANDLFSEENIVWRYIFDQIIIMLGHLGEGQHGVFKIKGTFSHKTSQLLFILKLSFSRIYIQKSIVSNPFNNENYVLCQYFNRQNGRMILDHIYSNYDEVIKNHQILLIDPSLMFNQDFQNNLKIYNDLCIITKNTTKDLYKEFAFNSNMDIYPNKQELLLKLSQLKTNKIDQYIEELKQGIPDLIDETKKTQNKKEQIIEKQAFQFDFSMFNNVKTNNKKKEKNNIYDISKKQSINTVYDDYLANADKIMSSKKEKPKKKKVQKAQDY